MSLPRINSRTPLHPFNSIDNHLSSQPMSLHVAYVLGALNPRKPKQRITFVALIILVCLTSYIFIANSAFLPPSIALRRPQPSSADQLALALETIQNARLADISKGHGMRKGHNHIRPLLKLDSAQELAAVSSFLASLPQNVIPHHADPELPIDPQLVLDFDTRGPRAQEEVRAMVEEVWLRNPVFVYSKVSLVALLLLLFKNLKCCHFSIIPQLRESLRIFSQTSISNLRPRSLMWIFARMLIS